MRPNILSLLGLLFLGLAVWRAIRVRRDLANGRTKWETALFGRGTPILYHESPFRFWCAIGVNTLIVLLFALVGAAAFRASSFGRF